ncbi:MAG: hypothetical protein AAB267_06625, partial [Candidatus Desantisbacteria bacterium]
MEKLASLAYYTPILNRNAYFLAEKAMVGLALRLAKEFPDKKIDEISREDFKRLFSVVAIIICAGEGTRFSPAFLTHKGVSAFLSTANTNLVWQSVKTMAIGARPVVPVGARQLRLIMKNPKDYDKVLKGKEVITDELEKEHIDPRKKRLFFPADAILTTKGESEEGGHGTHLINALRIYQEMGELDNVGFFQVHFGEHSPQGLETMIQSSWVTYLEAISCSFEEDILVSASSRYDDTIAQKGNFIYDSLRRLLNISDMHKVLIPLNPDSLRRGETLRRLQHLRQKAAADKKEFSYEGMEETEALLRKYKGKNLHELLKTADDTTKDTIKAEMKKLGEHLEKILKICLDNGLLLKVDKDVEKGYMLFTYEQERLMEELNIKKKMPINANKAIFHKKLLDFAKDYERYYVFEPGNLTFELMAWDLMRLLRREWRNLPAGLRGDVLGVYPVTSVDIAYPGYKSVGWTSSGTKDRQDETKLLGAFQEQFRRLFDEVEITYDKDTFLVYPHSTEGNALSREFLEEFKEALRSNYELLFGHIFIHLDEVEVELGNEEKFQLVKAIWLKDSDVLLVKNPGNPGEIVTYEVDWDINSVNYGRFVRKDSQPGPATVTPANKILYEQLHIQSEKIPAEAEYGIERMEKFLSEYKPVRELDGTAQPDMNKPNIPNEVDTFIKDRIDTTPQDTKDLESAFKGIKGGVTYDAKTLKLFLPKGQSLKDEKTAKKFKDVFTDDAEKGVKDPDDVRMFGKVAIDLDSHVGFYTHLRGTGRVERLVAILRSYIGRGWGIRDSRIIGSILVDHILKTSSPEFRLHLPILNTGYLDSLSALINTIAINSYIEVGAGVPLAIEGGRNCIVDGVFINAIIPAG